MKAPQAIWLRRLGGPLGRHAGTGHSLPPLAWLFFAATASWAILMSRQLSCVQTDPAVGVNTFRRMCYSDIPVLWQTKGIATGRVPFFSTEFEYPVLTGLFVEITRWFTAITGGIAPASQDGAALATANHAFVVTAVLSYLLFLLLIWAHWRMRPERHREVLMIALAPVVMSTGLINWDMLVIALTSVALLFWARSKPALSGVFLGLAVAAKFYPIFLLGAFLLLCWRAGRLRAFWSLLGAAAVTWLVVNLPVIFLAPDGWLFFWSYNSTRGADLGSVFYVLQLAGFAQPLAAVWAKVLLALGFIGIAWLVVKAPRRPRLAQVSFLLMAWFLMTNTVYSPQYALWLLPLLVLARPVWTNWLVFSLAELTYFMAVWAHLDTADGAAGIGPLYWIAVFLRVGVQAWLCLIIVFDMWNPREDPVRLQRIDDPIGGVLAGAPDAVAEVPFLKVRVGATRRPSPPDASEPSRIETHDSQRTLDLS